MRNIAGPEHAAVVTAAAPAALYTPAFVATCAVALLAFASQMVIQPILPLLVLELGGDAAVVGLIIAAFSLPSVVLRPVMGRLVDEWSHRRTMLLGTLGVGLSGLIYLIPNVVAILLGRVFHGTAWAAFNSAGHAMMARLAPATRRGEASSAYNLMPGIAQTVMPGVGLLLLGVTGTGGPFVLAALLGLAAWAVVVLGPIPDPPPTRVERATTWSGLLERSALQPMTLETLFTAVNSLFLVYPPVFAALHDIPVEQLAWYYPVYGATLITVRVLAGRVVDRVPRIRVVGGGIVLAIVALAAAAMAGSVAGLTLAGALYAAAAGFTSPTIMAMAIDRADPARMGAAMATYSLGYQLGLGLGAAMWGWLISIQGYPAPYLWAIGAELLALAVLLAAARRRGPTRAGAVLDG
jgi:MFS family permease